MTENDDICRTKGAILKGEPCLYRYNKDRGCKGCPMIPPKHVGRYPT